MTIEGKALALLNNALQCQIDKWGSGRSLSLTIWMTILTEEVGELAEAIYETEVTTEHSKPERGGYDRILTEVMQVAAVSMAIGVDVLMRQQSDAWKYHVE